MQAVIIPAWQRPEFLWACLHRLRAADRPHLRYLIALDRGHTPEVARVAREFRSKLGPSRVSVLRHRHPYRGNSYNVLESYRAATRMRVDLIHLVEEDIFVGADYFDYHSQAWALAPDAFAVSACHNQAFPVGQGPPSLADAVYYHGSYQSLGVSFRPETVRWFLTHAGQEYHRSPQAYLQSRFPASHIPPGHCEQDGLINRVREAAGRATVYPAAPRAYHAGFYGYNRRGGWTGPAVRESAMTRGAYLLGFNAEQLNDRARHYRDFTTVNLDETRPPVTRVTAWPE